MTAALLLACVLTALLAEGDALSCLVCRGTSASSCSTTVQTCPATSDVCVTQYKENTDAGTVKTEYNRYCGSSKTDCGKVESMTALWLTIRGNTTCCSTNSCSSPPPTVPLSSTTLNGLTCSACLTASSTYCYTKDTMKCTGIENKCAILGIKVTSGSLTTSVAFRGCANTNLCANFSYTSTTDGTTTDLTMACSDSSVRPENGLLLPILAGLLLMKLFS